MTLSEQARSVWAKFGYDPESRHWLPLWLHLLDAAAVAEHLARHWLAPTVLDLIEREFADSDSGLTPVEEFCLLTSWIAGVHDIGKCTPAFSVQAPALDDRMKETGLIHESVDPLERRKVPHALAGHVILKKWLVGGHGWDLEPAEALASVVGAHHGIPPTKADLTTDYDGHEHLLGEDEVWSATRCELLELVTRRTGAAALLPRWAQRRWSQPFLVELSGLLIVSDWIASTEAYFPLLPFEDDGARLLSPESHALRVTTGLSRLEIPAPWRPRDDGADPDCLLTSRFNLPDGSRATDVQARTLQAARSMGLPGMLIVQESTGGGKTEAALIAAEVLAARTRRSGILFALPTQATTDAMFSRELDWLERIEEAYAGEGAPSDFAAQLLHGHSRLNKEAQLLRRRGYEIRDRLLGSLNDSIGETPRPSGIGWDEEEARTGRVTDSEDGRRADLAILAWFSGRKKSMLSDFVVTTVDHLLFGAMRSPHLAMRHLGLSRKVVIVDEVHSYSTYMNVYLDRVLTWLAAYGVPVVLLSATLSEARCSAMVDAYRRGLRLAAGKHVRRRPAPENVHTPFPCLVTTSEEHTEVVPTASGRRSTVRMRRLTKDALIPLLEEALVDGGCALVVRNTVRRAQETYERLREHFGEDVSLNHARFTIGDRLAKDKDLLNRFGPPRKAGKRPYRAIVVATQVVEQSLDVDFDLLVTDLAPIDLVLQRMGRLHRHQQVEIDVQGLLDHLRGHDNGPVRARRAAARRSEAAQKILVLRQPVADGEAGVGEAHLLAESLPQQLVGLLCTSHRVADDERTAAIGQPLLQQRDQGVLHEPLKADRATSPRRRRDDLDPLSAGGDQAGEGGAHGLEVGACGDSFSSRQTQAPSIGVDHGGAPRLGQRRRQEHHRHSVGGEPGQDPIQVDIHIGGVGVHLVDDDDFAGQSQVPHGQVRGAHRPEEQVVHGGDDEVRQHRLLASAEPGQDRQVGLTAGRIA